MEALLDLPDELQQTILTDLDFNSLLSLSAINHRWRNAMAANHWPQYCSRNYLLTLSHRYSPQVDYKRIAMQQHTALTWDKHDDVGLSAGDTLAVSRCGTTVLTKQRLSNVGRSYIHVRMSGSYVRQPNHQIGICWAQSIPTYQTLWPLATAVVITDSGEVYDRGRDVTVTADYTQLCFAPSHQSVIGVLVDQDSGLVVFEVDGRQPRVVSLCTPVLECRVGVTIAETNVEVMVVRKPVPQRLAQLCDGFRP